MTDRIEEEADVVVLGGGPAGAVSAWLAAREGLSVVLVNPGMGRAERLESLSPRLRIWLESQGLLEGFDGLVGPLTRAVDWGPAQEAAPGAFSSEADQASRRENATTKEVGAFSSEADQASRRESAITKEVGALNFEFVVERTAFDAHLRAKAVEAGARLLRTTGWPEPGGAALAADGGRIRAGWVVDARGRQRGAKTDRRAPSTLAICGWAAAEGLAPGSKISALEQGWLWRVATPDGRLWLQFCGDARAPGGMSEKLEAAFRAAEPEARGFRLIGPPGGWAAAPVLSRRIGDLRRLSIGDAYAAADPLSGHGQFWAVSSALAAAAARRTLTARPGERTEALCRRHLTARTSETMWRNARIGRDFIRMETRFAQAPFWSARRDFPDDHPAHEARTEFRIMIGTVVRDGLIEEAHLLLTPRTPAGIAWFGEIPAAEAWLLFEKGKSVEKLVERWGPAALSLPEIFAREARPA